MRKIFKRIKNIDTRFLKKLDVFSVVNLGLFAYQILYLFYSYNYINKVVPIWYSGSWGLGQLAPKIALFLIPLTSLSIFICGLLISILLKKYNLRYSLSIITLVVLVSNVILTRSVLRIVGISSVPIVLPFNLTYFQLLKSFLISVILTLLIAPFFIRFAFSKNIVTNPLA